MTVSLRRLRQFTLTSYLTFIVLIAVLPVLLFSAFMINRLSEAQLEESKKNLLRTSQDLAHAFDDEIRSSIRTLEALTQPKTLQDGQLKDFHAVLARVLKGQTRWRTILLIDLNGRRLLSARQPYGTDLGNVVDLASFKSILETAQPTVGRLSAGDNQRQDRESGFAVRVPVRNPDGKIIYILSAVLGLEATQELVTRFATVEGEWVRALVDSNGNLAGRSRDPEKFKGAKATGILKDLIAKGPQAEVDGIYMTKTLDQVPAFTAIARAPSSGWYAVIAVPETVLFAPIKQAQRTSLSAGLTMLVLSGLATIILSRRVTKLILSGSNAAAKLAKGVTPKTESSNIQELQELHTSLSSASALLQSRDKAKSDFLANMSHELRTPLGIVLGLTDLLSKGAVPEEERSKSWEILQRNGQHLQRLIDDILDFSKLEANRLTFENLGFSIHNLITAITEDFANLAAKKEIQLNLVIEAASPRSVTSDPVRVRQILSNLIGNALKFTESGSVTIRLHESESNSVRVTIEDTGIGLSSDQQDQLFREFTQGDSSHTRKFGGTGLGLSLSRKLARLLGGDVRLLESRVGKGSIFEFTFLSQSSMPATQVPHFESAPPASELHRTNLNILLTDDSPDNISLIKLYLRETKANVVAATNGAEAITLASENDFDLILMDIQMPDVDGYQATKKIRDLGVKTPIIALTAHALDEHRKRALESGFNAFLSKPVKKSQLLETMASALQS